MYVQTATGPYMDGPMPLSNSFQTMWPEDPYNSYSMCDWGEDNSYTHASMLRPAIEEQKYSPALEFDHQPFTAVGKASPLVEGLFARREDSKPMKQWSPHEVMEWLCEEARKYNIEYENVHLKSFYGVDGCMLLKMTPYEFMEKDSQYGRFLFQAVDRHRRSEEAYRDDNLPPFKNIRPQDDFIITDLSDSLGCRPVLSALPDDSYTSDASTPEPPDVKPQILVPKPAPPPGGRRPGRPPKPTRAKRGNKEKRCGRLWEFIRDLLLKPEYCPSLICWENHDEGVFRFVRSDKVAELWGTIKDNPKMTYEKLSRAMRYYYKSQVLQPVLGRRLVYKFGPTARGWRTNNPNFRDSTK